MMISAVRKEEAARLEGYSAGANDYVEIPFRHEELVTGYGATAQPPSGELDLVAGIIGKPFDFDQVTGTIARVVAP